MLVNKFVTLTNNPIKVTGEYLSLDEALDNQLPGEVVEEVEFVVDVDIGLLEHLCYYGVKAW